MVKRRSGGIYHFFIMLPNRCYPFANQVQGEWVRGVRSANVELKRAVARYGPGSYGYKFASYRQIFHLAGSLLVIYLATFIAFHFFDSVTALTLLLALVTALITYQEFFYQRRHYLQHWSKAIADWLTWVVPMFIYLAFFS